MGGIGRLGPAPGTWASAAALPAAWALHGLGGFLLLAGATAAAAAAGLWAVARLTAGADDPDRPEIVIDELAGQWLALWPLSAGLGLAGAGPWVFPWPGWLLAFLAFRLFDIWKPGPIGRADRRRDAAGVMGDDLLAGLAAAVVVALAGALAHGGMP
ncbi:MAG: phosphatidylglycerophosphatase A [Rhodobacteraceae bacterium]|nr:phosphatidylglycerophosphatase A [Paracoccaceae bacterium]